MKRRADELELLDILDLEEHHHDDGDIHSHAEEDSDGNPVVRDHINNCSFFFFIPHGTNPRSKPFLYFDSPIDKIDNLRGVSMNEKYIFLWNDGYSWKIDVETQERSQMKLCISLNEK